MDTQVYACKKQTGKENLQVLLCVHAVSTCNNDCLWGWVLGDQGYTEDGDILSPVNSFAPQRQKTPDHNKPSAAFDQLCDPGKVS